jgi:hypothetical protein
MSKMDELILDRLIREVTQVHVERLANVTIELERTRKQLQNSEAQRDRLSRENQGQAEIVAQLRSGEKPITDLYLAVDELIHATSSTNRTIATEKVRAAMKAAEPHVDLIPL